MTSSTILSTDERYAAAFAIVEDLEGLGESLIDMCHEFTNAPIAELELRAGDVVGQVRMISQLMRPLERLADAGEVAA